MPAIAEPLDALEYARYGGDNALKRAHVARMITALRSMQQHEGLATDVRSIAERRKDPIMQITFGCNRTDDVMTAWALGPEDKAKLLTMFLIETELARSALAEKLALANIASSEAESLTQQPPDSTVRLFQERAIAENVQLARDSAMEEEAASVARQRLHRALAEQVTAPFSPPPPPSQMPSPVPSPGPAVAPAESSPPPRVIPAQPHGWVYLGEVQGTRWRTRYFRSARSSPGELRRGDRLITVGRSFLRSAMPDAKETFGARLAVLRRGEIVEVSGAPSAWQDTGFWWVPVRRTGSQTTE